MGILSLLGFGERKKKVLAYLAKNVRIIDLRMPEGFALESIEDSINMSLDEIEARVDKVKKLGSPIILCCSSGLRSDEAAVFLRDEGIDAINGGTYKRLKKIVDEL